MDLTVQEATKLATRKTARFERSKNLEIVDFDLAIEKIAPKKSHVGIKKSKKRATVPKTKAPKDGFDVHSHVGSRGILEGEALILAVLKKASKPLTASEVGKRIFKQELTKKGVEYVVEVRGYKFYAYLNKHYTPMLNKKLIKCSGLAKGHRKMEKVWEAVRVK